MSSNNSATGSVRFTFSKNSLSNSTISCDALGLHYQLSTPSSGMKLNRTISISRRHPSGQGYVHIADWERKGFGNDQFRWAASHGGGDQFRPLFEVFPKNSELLRGSRFDQTFVANGKTYVWKSRDWSLKLFCRDDGDALVASFHRRRWLLGRRKAYLDLSPNNEGILDYIIVTCVISEWGRRKAQETAVAAVSVATTNING